MDKVGIIDSMHGGGGRSKPATVLALFMARFTSGRRPSGVSKTTEKAVLESSALASGNHPVVHDEGALLIMAGRFQIGHLIYGGCLEYTNKGCGQPAIFEIIKLDTEVSNESG